MAHWIMDYKEIPHNEGEPAIKADYDMDSAADVMNLPSYPAVRYGSTAFDVSTKKLFELSSNGWVALN